MQFKRTKQVGYAKRVYQRLTTQYELTVFGRKFVLMIFSPVVGEHTYIGNPIPFQDVTEEAVKRAAGVK